jgi:archaellum component FlaC
MLQSLLSKVLQSEQFSNLMQNEALMKVVLSALETSVQLKGTIDQQTKKVLEAFSLVHKSEVELLDAQIKDLESQVESLKNQVQVLIKEKLAAQAATKDALAQVHALNEAKAKVETLKTPKVETPKVETPKVETPKVEKPKVETPKADQSTQKQAKPSNPGIKWNSKMNKAELLEIAGKLKIEGLSETSTRQVILDALSAYQG